jgi:hypothetical protein
VSWARHRVRTGLPVGRGCVGWLRVWCRWTGAVASVSPSSLWASGTLLDCWQRRHGVFAAGVSNVLGKTWDGARVTGPFSLCVEGWAEA